MNETTVNIPLLRKAVEWAEAEAAKPEKDSQWWQEGIIVNAAEIGRDCGTCYCIAGFIAEMVDGPQLEPKQSIRIAMDALGLNLVTLDGLFGSSNTIADVRRIAEDIAGERL